MRRPLVAGNWKMHGSRATVRALMTAIRDGLGDGQGADVLVLPPAVYIPDVVRLAEGSVITVGAQNVADQDQGAYTGEIAADMLTDLGCFHALVGHSERRLHYGESDTLVAARFAAAIRHGVTPVLCVGETLEQRENGDTEAVLAAQIDAVAEHVDGDALTRSVVAYEPVWAIGTGRTATPEQAQSAHAFIRARLAGHGAAATQVRLLYGGSVKPETAAELFAMADIDGALVGGASLKANEFINIVARAP
ncbi:triose-phosphate isomerase [Aquisalimonas sp.]|uniref:triose-phosphate isomerase n=1 Tax=unclassified Aquisalimonas TaxID=2644645 RepID=UPI0025C6876A|nr:triose-phosphate isomerase [Aquisalimonas sp.]